MRSVLISGASVAGPALAYWLAHHGFTPTIVEISPGPRTGGYAVDFRDEAHLTVLRRMGVHDDLHALATGGSPMSFIDASGAEIFALPPEFAGGDIEVLRSDLARVLIDRTKHTTEYLFGDSITSLTETPDGVHVTFTHAPPRTFDLVVGADGLHSNVRRLAFGPEPDYLTHLGYHVARWPLPNADPVSLTYTRPGRMISIYDNHRGGADAFVVFTTDPLDYDRHDLHQQRKIIADTYTDMGWRTPALLEPLWTTPELYFDSISRIDLPTWSHGRIALLGDAAYGATVGGMGTGSAVVGAYVLAGELADAGGDHHVGFAAYEAALRDYVTACQEGGGSTGAFLAPATAEALAQRDAMMRSPEFLAEMLAAGAERANGIEVKPYGM